MNIQELRIGNIIKFNWWFNSIGIVDLIDGAHGYVTMVSHSDEFTLDELSPVPITDEWLLHFGFFAFLNSSGEKTGYFDHPTENFHVVTGVKPWVYIVDQYSEHQLNLDIQYVHQLQNLYFCLTGQELEVKNG